MMVWLLVKGMGLWKNVEGSYGLLQEVLRSTLKERGRETKIQGSRPRPRAPKIPPSLWCLGQEKMELTLKWLNSIRYVGS